MKKYRPRRDHDQLSVWTGSSTTLAAEKVENDSSAAEVLRRFGPDPDQRPEYADCTFWENACEEMLEEEAKWQQLQRTFAWIDQVPTWVNATCWEMIANIAEPTEPCTRQFRLSLIGGGQIRVTEEYRFIRHKGFSNLDPWLTCFDRRELRVQAKTEEGLYTAHGVLDNAIAEMSADLVVFPGHVPQAIADRVAATFRLIDSRDDFMALLLPSDRCGCCGRPLKDEVSRLLNIGPNCAKALRLPHDLATANRVLARRRELLGDQP
jgi:hypothetical protein